jgi:glycogen operon protein
VSRVADALPGRAAPLGATLRDGGTNFALASGIAEAVELCLFDDAGAETRIELPEYDYGVWHGFVPEVGPGQAYGYRVHGPWDPASGRRCNPAKLLLDPYARAVHGEVTNGPEVLDYDPASPSGTDSASALDSAGHVPRGYVTDPAFDWGGDTPPLRSMADTIIYEAHVKGLTMRHPDVPEQLRGSYAGLAHEAVIEHLTRLGVTAVELLPVHQYVPESFLVERGLTNYWVTTRWGTSLRTRGTRLRPGAARRRAARWRSSRAWSGRCTRPGWKSSWTWSSTTPPRAGRAARRCVTAGWTTRRTTGWSRATRGSTTTRPARVTR